MEDEEVIDKVYESMQAVVDGLNVRDDDILEHYEEFDSSTELLNFIQDEIVLQEGDIDRVLDVYEDAKCHRCWEELQEGLDGDIDDEISDPTLDTEHWVTQDNSYRQGDEDRFTGVVLGYCDEHHEVFIEYEEVFYD